MKVSGQKGHLIEDQLVTLQIQLRNGSVLSANVISLASQNLAIRHLQKRYTVRLY